MGQRSSVGGRGARGSGWSGATPRVEPPAPHAGSIRHLSWSPWRPRTERGGGAAVLNTAGMVHGTPRDPALLKDHRAYLDSIPLIT
ncbi:jg16376 [Pararge aegeria aegeria]|uniref:Jg16376 protein n=1 Tax=Pararge aegeria aegeria TaxID=348720 RepID=A0A8S4SB62_9NEOP|nr:jg16376 [Pararge aegeria aegeria]